MGFRCVDEADNGVDATVEGHARIKIQGEIGSWRGVAKIAYVSRKAPVGAARAFPDVQGRKRGRTAS